MELFDDELFGTMPLSPPSPEERNTPRASLFTLIVVAKDTERVRHCQRLVNLIATKLPCKVVFIGIDSGAKETFLQERHTTKVAGNGSTPVSCELVTVTVSPDQLHRIPFLVIPEIIADLPAFLLAGDLPSEVSPVLDLLERYVSRVVFDAPKLSNIGLFADHILSLPSRAKYVDLNWARTKPWREALCRVFNTKESSALLSAANRIELRYNHRPVQNQIPDSQVLLLQAWLGSRLGWELDAVEEAVDHSTIRYTHQQRQTTVIITPTDSPVAEDGTVVSVEIKGDNETHFLLGYEKDDTHIVVHASSQDRCEIPYCLFVGSFQRGRALPSEVFLLPPSEHYLTTLEGLASQHWRKDRPR
jgi:glucose-6-phosphate dehydrogenase assembly protein OpcA